MPKLLVVVTGASGSCKTTLSQRLASDLNMPLLAKDDIKEFLFDRLPQSDRQWSTIQGRAAISMMFAGAADILNSGSAVMLESLFHPQFAKVDIDRLLGDTGATLLEIHCYASHDLRQERWRERSSTHRHPGHLDDPHKILNEIGVEPLYPIQATVINTGLAGLEYDKAYSELLGMLNANLNNKLGGSL